MRPLLRYPHLRRGDDHLRQGRVELRTGARPRAAGLCPQRGSHRAAGSNHHLRFLTTEEDAAKKGTEMGRKHIVPYGLYRAEGFVSANLARKTTGFTEEDLAHFVEKPS